MSLAEKRRQERESVSSMVIEPELLKGLLVRCRSCGEFKPRADCSLAGCTVCDWHTACCRDCEGDGHSVRRRVLAHHRYFASKRGAKQYGDAHAVRWSEYDTKRPKRRLKILKGGK